MRSHEKGKKQSFNDIDCFFFVYHKRISIYVASLFLVLFVCYVLFISYVFVSYVFVYLICFVYLLSFICLISDTLDLRRADNIALFALTY